MRFSRTCLLVVIGVSVAGYAGGCANTGQNKNEQAMQAPRPMPKLSARTHASYGMLLERQGNFEAAALQYTQALELRPDDIASRNRLGITLNKLGRHAQATEQFRLAVIQSPETAFLHNNLGFSLLLAANYAEAEVETRKALELRPTFTRARMNHGIALAKQGFYEAALEEFRRIGDGKDAHYNLAMLQADAGQYSLATASLEEAVRQNPEYEPARRKLERLSKLHPKAAQPATPAPVVAGGATSVIKEEASGMSQELEESTEGSQPLSETDTYLASADVAEPATDTAAPAVEPDADAGTPELDAQLASELASLLPIVDAQGAAGEATAVDTASPAGAEIGPESADSTSPDPARAIASAEMPVEDVGEPANATIAVEAAIPDHLTPAAAGGDEGGVETALLDAVPVADEASDGAANGWIPKVAVIMPFLPPVETPEPDFGSEIVALDALPVRDYWPAPHGFTDREEPLWQTAAMIDELPLLPIEADVAAGECPDEAALATPDEETEFAPVEIEPCADANALADCVGMLLADCSMEVSVVTEILDLLTDQWASVVAAIADEKSEAAVANR